MSKWLTYYKKNPQAQVRLFCFPYAGGAASVYRTWNQQLPSFIEVCPVQMPGRENRLSERPFSQIGALIPVLIDELKPYMDKPFAFFGHSMGGLVSHELANALEQQEDVAAPIHLFISGRNAPQCPERRPPIHALPKSEFLQELDRYNGTPKAVLQSTEIMELFIPTLRADFSLCEQYQYDTESSPLNIPISAFGGLEDEDAPHEDLESWREITAQSFKLRMFPGDHFFLHKNLNLLLRAIAQDLARSLKSSMEVKSYANGHL